MSADVVSLWRVKEVRHNGGEINNWEHHGNGSESGQRSSFPWCPIRSASREDFYWVGCRLVLPPKHRGRLIIRIATNCSCFLGLIDNLNNTPFPLSKHTIIIKTITHHCWDSKRLLREMKSCIFFQASQTAHLMEANIGRIQRYHNRILIIFVYWLVTLCETLYCHTKVIGPSWVE